MDYKKLGWNAVDDSMPASGQLCAVFFPVGVNQITDKAIGPIAFAYLRNGEWIMADEPTGLRGLMATTGPAYWKPWDVDTPNTHEGEG